MFVLTMEPKFNGRYALFSVSFFALQCFVASSLLRSSSLNIADGLVIKISSGDIIATSTFHDQETRSFLECAVLCLQTKSCLSVYFVRSSSTCFLNNDFLPQYFLRSSYTPSTAVDLLGWDPRGLVNIILFLRYLSCFFFYRFRLLSAFQV